MVSPQDLKALLQAFYPYGRQGIHIVPSNEEFLKGRDSAFPVNKVGRPFSSEEDYFSTQFRVFREDFVDNFREVVDKYVVEGVVTGAQIYKNVRIAAVKIEDAEVQLRLTFPGYADIKDGSLFCLSHDDFRSFTWVIAASSRTFQLADGAEYELLDPYQQYVMLESSQAYFLPYHLVLKCLQRPEMRNIPFQEHLVFLEPLVKQPRYLLERHSYDFSSVFPDFTERVHLLQNWPNWGSCPLDESQVRALRHGLTKGLALIQGPPGTGKTFVSLLTVKTLLANLGHSTANRSLASSRNGVGPILIVCYTNHALDQFLEGILKTEKNIIRMGRRSKSEVLTEYLFHTKLKRWKMRGSVKALAKAAKEKCERLKTQICECVQGMENVRVTEATLQGLATPDQICCLFDPWEKDPLKTWLTDDDDECEEVDVDEGSTTEGNVAGEETELSMEAILSEPDVWKLSKAGRGRLHQHWIQAIHDRKCQRLSDITRQYRQACDEHLELRNMKKLSVMKSARVIGMTTTTAARLYDFWLKLKPQIVIVEEAAEVMEAHVLACMTPHLQHLILVGDHMQLRPATATYKFAVDHILDVSMFERLVRGGVEHVTLNVQRRMKPCISKLISGIYPTLQDHVRVQEYEDVRGIKSSLYFFHHEGLEETVGSSKVNVAEAEMIVKVTLYLLQQDSYGPEDITILAMYSSQVAHIIGILGRSGKPPFPRVSSVDDYQGEENKVILLSLVRNNAWGGVGFLKTPNRVCVALSRAKLGLYIFGNAEQLGSSGSLWRNIIDGLKDDGLLGNKLTLCCQNHPDRETSVSCPEDFRMVKDGGCNEVCQAQLKCGHGCPKRCHPGSHETVVCLEGCWKPLVCSHICNFPCHGTSGCPPCSELVTKVVEECGHQQSMTCSAPAYHSACRNACEKVLACSHRCTRDCGESCVEMCTVMVARRSPCGHTIEVQCSQLPLPECREMVRKELPCGHVMEVPCFEKPVCREIVVRSLPCGHTINTLCSNESPLPGCRELVLKNLSCGHQVSISCSEDPIKEQCKEPCRDILEGCKHACPGTCGLCKQGKQYIKCRHKCEKGLPCGHRCEAKCSSICPPCTLRCQKRWCPHKKCSLTCREPCKPCLKSCSWRCKHYHCELRCHQLCERPRCDYPCEKMLPCGHACIGICGEKCPTKCRVCHPQTLEGFYCITLDDSPLSQRFIELHDCGHIFEVTSLDAWIEDNHEEGIKCPKCKATMMRSFRYGNEVKKAVRRSNRLKSEMVGNELVRSGIHMLQLKDNDEAIRHFQDAIRTRSGLLEAHLNIGLAFGYRSDFSKAAAHFKFIVAASQWCKYAESIHVPVVYSPVPRKQHESITEEAVDAPSEEMTAQALIGWASAMAKLKYHKAVAQLCDLVLNHASTNREEAASIKRMYKL